jgi:hypothetical protein
MTITEEMRSGAVARLLRAMYNYHVVARLNYVSNEAELAMFATSEEAEAAIAKEQGTTEPGTELVRLDVEYKYRLAVV